MTHQFLLHTSSYSKPLHLSTSVSPCTDLVDHVVGLRNAVQMGHGQRCHLGEPQVGGVIIGEDVTLQVTLGYRGVVL